MAYDFIAVGGATRDISFFTDQGVLISNAKDVLRQKLLGFEYGAKIKVDRFIYSFGGGAANAAVNLAHFGFKTACLAAIGDDEDGRHIRANLRRRKVAADWLETFKGEESGSAFVLIVPTGERVDFVQRGANKRLTIGAREKALLKKAKNIYIASLSGDWEMSLRTIFSLTRPGKAAGTLAGPNIFWNPGGLQYASGFAKIAPFIKKTAVFCLNKDEALELVLKSRLKRQIKNEWLLKPRQLLTAIKSFGPQVVVITDGAKGVYAYDGRKFYFSKAAKDRRRVDTTGIGDVFNSSFAAGFGLYRGDINKAIRLGILNTASKIAHLGAQNGLMPYKKNQKI